LVIKGDNLVKRFGLYPIIVFLFLLPLFIKSGFYMHILIMTAVNVILAVSLWLIIRAGQLSIGHAAFMAIGAYTSALLAKRIGLSFWLALPTAGTVAGIAALLIGYPTLRLKGLYFAITTFAFAEILRTVLNSFGTGLFGGPSGISGIPHPSLFTIDFSSRIPYYYLVLALALLTILVVQRINSSRIGMILSAISQADSLAESVGINIMRYKVFAFVIGGFFAGVAGSFFAHYFTYISPEHFTFWISVYVVIYVVVGGSAIIAGPILGACALSFFHESFRTFGSYEPIVFGSALILVLLFLPGGLVSLPRQLLLLAERVVKQVRKVGSRIPA
jgi:branched-chain amino acid transport system permease protein